MKNKNIFRTLTALCAALILTGGFSVTAHAQVPEGADDATDDSGVVYEEPKKEEPLTPDGNATLVDDFGGNKQLITVTTKNGKAGVKKLYSPKTGRTYDGIIVLADTGGKYVNYRVELPKKK